MVLEVLNPWYCLKIANEGKNKALTKTFFLHRFLWVLSKNAVQAEYCITTS